MTLTHSATGLWMYNYHNEGSCFGPASEEMVYRWSKRTGPYITYSYFGYEQKVVLSEYRGCGDKNCACMRDAVTHKDKKNIHTVA